MQAVEVRDAMTLDVDTVSADLSLAELEQAFAVSHHHGFPSWMNTVSFAVSSRSRIWNGPVRKGTSMRLRVRDIATPSPLTVFPDEPVWVALKRLGARDVGRLPVVDRKQPRRLGGDHTPQRYRSGLSTRHLAAAGIPAAQRTTPIWRS